MSVFLITYGNRIRKKLYYGSRHPDIVRAVYLNLNSMITEMKDMRKTADLEIELTAV